MPPPSGIHGPTRQGAGAASPAPSRRQAEETTARLLETGRAAFARRGLAGTNLREDILEPAGVSVGSFYHRFQDKTELLLAILRDDADRFRRDLRELQAQLDRPPLEIARASYALLFSLAERNEDALRVHLKERDGTDARVRAFLRDERDRWVESLAENYARMCETWGVEVDCTLAAELVTALSLGTAGRYLELPPQERPGARGRLIEGLAQLTVAGIGGVQSLPEEDGT